METADKSARRDVPAQVEAAFAAADRSGFTYSCTPEMGRLLASVAASKPGGRIAESGTGLGVGSAWLRSGLTGGATLVTVERDAQRAAEAGRLFDGDGDGTVLTGDWRLLAEHAPFDVFFCDGGGKRNDPQGVVDLLAPGGVLLLDDFAPATSWPPLYDGQVDELRVFYLTHPLLTAVEVGVGPISVSGQSRWRRTTPEP